MKINSIATTQQWPSLNNTYSNRMKKRSYTSKLKNQSFCSYTYIEFGNRILNFSNKCDIGKHHGVNYLTGQVKKERQRILAFRFATFQEVLCYL